MLEMEFTAASKPLSGLYSRPIQSRFSPGMVVYTGGGWLTEKDAVGEKKEVALGRLVTSNGDPDTCSTSP